MKVIVTCGPGHEPINQVRRLTNFSAGEVGVHLRNQLARAGFEVFCLKGSGATHQGPGERCYFPFQLAFHLRGASVGPRSPQRLAKTEPKRWTQPSSCSCYSRFPRWRSIQLHVFAFPHFKNDFFSSGEHASANVA
jgi:hypothetical protein